MEDIRSVIEKTKKSVIKDALSAFLEKYLNPAFGSLPKREVDLLVMDLLEKLKYIEHDPSIYTLVQKLRVTRSKARNLFYDMELRRLNVSELDAKVKNILKTPLIQRQGDLFALEIENPLVLDHLRAKVQAMGHATDGSFSPSMVKLTGDAFAALIAHFLKPHQREQIRKALIAAGAPDTSFQGVLKSAFKKLGCKIASDAGEALAGEVSDYIGPLVDGIVGEVDKIVGGLFRRRTNSC